jgi:hypothetical protein
MQLVRAGDVRDDIAGIRVELYGVVSQISGEVLEVFTSRAEADELVATWDADEPDEAGALEVVDLVIDCALN